MTHSMYSSINYLTVLTKSELCNLIHLMSSVCRQFVDLESYSYRLCLYCVIFCMHAHISFSSDIAPDCTFTKSTGLQNLLI